HRGMHTLHTHTQGHAYTTYTHTGACIHYIHTHRRMHTLHTHTQAHAYTHYQHTPTHTEAHTHTIHTHTHTHTDTHTQTHTHLLINTAHACSCLTVCATDYLCTARRAPALSFSLTHTQTHTHRSVV